MYVPYNQISSDARVWIYQSDRAFNAAEKTDIEIIAKASATSAVSADHSCGYWFTDE